MWIVSVGNENKKFGSVIFWIGKKILGAVLGILGVGWGKRRRRVKEKKYAAALKKILHPVR